jgi:membrane-bound inhibitor of C-type lysozyme
MAAMIDPNLTLQAHTSLETQAPAQAHTMLEETLHCWIAPACVTVGRRRKRARQVTQHRLLAPCRDPVISMSAAESNACNGVRDGRADARSASTSVRRETTMKPTAAAIAAVVAAMTLSACSGLWPFGRSDSEAKRVPPGATEYACADGKRLLVRFSEDGKSAWIFYPEREFRLDRSGGSDRYSNGITTLSLQGDSAQLDSEGMRQFADCKRKTS